MEAIYIPEKASEHIARNAKLFITYPSSNKNYSPMVDLSGSVYIDNDLLSKISEDTLYVILLHEAGHIIFRNKEVFASMFKDGFKKTIDLMPSNQNKDAIKNKRYV